MLDWKIYAVGSAFFAGLTAVLAKVGVKNISSNLATFIRTVVIILFLGVLIGVRREWRNPLLIDRHSMIFLILSAFATGLSWICYFRALQTGPASIVSPIDKLSLVFAVILSVMFLGERLGAYQWAGVGLITIGTLLIILR
ncbi:MAG: EamA family transporter [Candidatus Omnitrophica bacterium]|jgi:transporter family protein|nr:EamA family transporter [Candidatus Omnitrophota bacterium]